MIPRVLEPEVMDTVEEARDYDRMDHAAVNRLFASDFLAAAQILGVELTSHEMLDLGTGTALIPIELCRQRAGLKILACDAAESMLALARQNVSQAGMADRIACELVDAKRMPFADGRFSAVMSNSIVHHIPEPLGVLREAIRVVRPGGLLFFRDLLRPANHDELEKLVKQYAGGENARSQKMFAESLHAALTLSEIRQMVEELGFDPEGVAQTSDRHWTWQARKSPTRRDALKTGLAFGAAALVGASPARAADPSDPIDQIVDAHQHLWELKRFKLPWLAGEKKLNRDFTIADFREATRGIPIVKSVYVEVDVEPSERQAEADWIAELCRQGEGVPAAAVIAGRPESAEFAAYAQQFRDHPHIRGMRRLLHRPDTPQGYCLQKEFLNGVRLLGDLGLSFDITIQGANLGDVPKLIDACPGTFFILDHCGNPDLRSKELTAWKRDLAETAKRENVVCKVSGIIALVDPENWSTDDLAPVVNHVLDEFGPYRVMFGGDWPVCDLGANYQEWFKSLRAIVAERPVADQRRLFHDNAMRHYRLG